MIFTSFEFVLFFCIVVGVRSLLRNESLEKWFLLSASYLFYMSWNPAYILLILLISTTDFLVGHCLAKTESQTSKRRLVATSLIINLGVLAFFKYATFAYENLRACLSLGGISIPPANIHVTLPVGISFFTFQSLSYVLDIYRGKLSPCRHWRDYLLYVAFFPQLVAGPIVRASEFLPQLLTRVRGSLRDIETGLAYIALGAVKKLVISDQISQHVDVVFATPSSYDAFSLLQGLLGYAIQIYCDFSGYTDIAIGCARTMGYRFNENFRMPYSSVNITEFWRRWHISLSSWLRDYLYISLGGNRRGRNRTYFNLMITMLLGGLWHGASWNFVIWGGIHGSALAIHKLFMEYRNKPDRPQEANAWYRTIPSRILTLIVVLMGWVFFRAQTLPDAVAYLQKIALWNQDGTRFFSPYIWPALLAVVLVHLIARKDVNWAESLVDRPAWIRCTAYAGLLTLIVCLGATDAAPFIYFQF
ncbi:MAG: hypothetical protein RI897_1284 [Verrucomicrobiota bacterium]|jgi:alginate O-acetyltransferase complex protein AlgI